jgi:hypothetical protein
MNHLMTNVYRSSEDFDRAFDDFDGTVNTGTKAAGIGKQDVHVVVPLS